MKPRNNPATAWLVGGLEVALIMASTIWLLTSPALFRWYYPRLNFSSHTHDAAAIVDWLSTDYRERTLGLATHDRKLDMQELKHYSDVRRVFQRFPELIAILAAATILSVLSSPAPRQTIRSAQAWGLLLWGGFLLCAGGLALWDWERFFALVHHPFFGDVSWRLSDDAYSLVLFPARFWGFAMTAVLLAPPLLMVPIRIAINRLRLNQSEATSPLAQPRLQRSLR
jgi:uncharacterized membrane protein